MPLDWVLLLVSAVGAFLGSTVAVAARDGSVAKVQVKAVIYVGTMSGVLLTPFVFYLKPDVAMTSANVLTASGMIGIIAYPVIKFVLMKRVEKLEKLEEQVLKKLTDGGDERG